MKTWNDYPVVLNTKQAAELLGINHVSTVSEQCRTGVFPAIKLDNGNWRIDRDKLRAMFATVLQKNHSLADQLGEIELALSTLAAIHRGKEIEETIRVAHQAALEAYTQAR